MVSVMVVCSEFQARFPGCLGQCFHTAMVQISSAVKDDLDNPCCKGSLGEQLTNGYRCLATGPAAEARPQVLVKTRGRGDGVLGGIVNDLGINVLV